MNNDTGIPINQYKVKALPTFPKSNSIYWVKADTDTVVTGYITDSQGIAVPLAGFNTGNMSDKEDKVNKTQVISGNSVVQYPSEKAVVDYVASKTGSLLREEFDYVGSQTFTLSFDYSQVYTVDVKGVGALSTDQYNLVYPNMITITDPLEAGDYIVVLYGNAAAGAQPYYTQAEADALLNFKEDLVNKQNSMEKDGTGTKYPTIDAANEILLRNTRLFSRTGIANKNDQFELEVFDTNTIRIKACDTVVFWEELFVEGAISGDAVKTFPEKIYSLLELETPTGGNINTHPITTDGLYVRYLGYDKDGNVVSSENNFVDNSFVAQLGFATVVRSAGVLSFLGGITPGARNVFSQPILANINDLQRTITIPETDVTVDYNIGTPSLRSNAGSITGLAINWRGISNPNNTSPIDRFNYPGDNGVDFISLTPDFLSQTTAPTMHILWTELEEGIAINNSFYNTTSQTRDTLAANTFGVKRVLIGLRGGMFIQESEFAANTAYATIDEARANVFTHNFTDSIIPPDVVIEIARIVFKQGVTDFSDENEFIIVITAGGSGSGGAGSLVGDATTVSKGIVQLAGDLSGTASNPTVPGLALKQDTLVSGANIKTVNGSSLLGSGDLAVGTLTGSGTPNKVPRWTALTGLVDSNITDNGTTISTSTDMNINGLTFGRGEGNIPTNLAGGAGALGSNTVGGNIVALGNSALFNNTVGGFLVGIGALAGTLLADKVTLNQGSLNSIFLGYRTSPLADGQTNQIVIGHDANGLGSNSAVFGNDSILKTALKGRVLIGTTTDNTVDAVQITGSLLATTIKKLGGTSAQFLKADGSVDTVTYANNANVIHTSGNETRTGSLTSDSFIKAGGLSTQYLMADGSVTSTLNTATVVAGTTYTLLSTDHNKQVIFSSASPVTITVPLGLPTGFICEIYQQGVGKLSFITPVGGTLRYATYELPQSEEQYASIFVVGIINMTDTYKLDGDLQSI